MNVLVAGGTGAIGRELVPLLVSQGHKVTVLGRSRERGLAAANRGAAFARADALDPVALRRVFEEVKPEAVINLLTAIPQKLNPKKLASEFEQTNRLRTAGTRNLITLGNESDVSRFVAESVAYAYDPRESGPASEDAPLWESGPKQFRPVVEALRDLETQTLAASGVILRLGHLYGPGTAFAHDGFFTEQVRERKVPLVGEGSAVFSFIHVADAAAAFAAALSYSGSGAFNIVDDEPSEVREWLPTFAEAMDAEPPKRAPALLAKLFVGEWGLAYMTRLRGASNERAKAALGWEPKFKRLEEGIDASSAGLRAPAMQPA